MIKTPLVSVVLPVYNAELFIREAVQCILDQTFKNLELIIINDGSVDKTEEIVLSFIDNRIKYIKNEQNLQLIQTLNKGIDLAQGKYIARMDADDIAMPTRIEKQVSFLEKNTDVVVCSNGIIAFDDKELFKYRYYPTKDKEIRCELIYNSPFAHPSTLFRSDIVKNNNIKFKSEYKFAEDYYFWFELLKYGKGANIPEFLLKYRILATSETAKGESNKYQRYLTISKIQKKILESQNVFFSAENLKLHYYFSLSDKIKQIDFKTYNLKDIFSYFKKIKKEHIYKKNIKYVIGEKMLKLFLFRFKDFSFFGIARILFSTEIYYGVLSIIIKKIKYVK